MIIRIERTGGVAGIPISYEMDIKDVPEVLLRKAKKILGDKKSSSLPLKLTPMGSADHYTYKISIQDGMDDRVLECNQYTIGDDLRSLVKYIERNSKRKNK